MAIGYQREITHKGYGKADIGLQKYYHKVEKKISERPLDKTSQSISKKTNFTYLDDTHIMFVKSSHILPQMGGAMALLPLLLSMFFLKEWTITSYIMNSLAGLIFIFFIIYYFTMPNKEKILNRKDGLITFPGFYWQPNITMHFDDMIFAYSTGGEDSTGGFMLQTIRPSKGHTFCLFTVGRTCYEDMSFITWYMDKNRPLPPGDAFDKYRQRDFERRKAAGFPKPLYFSKVPTPEATPEQQDERKRIGGW